MAMKHYTDLLGSELRLNTKSYRRQSAVRRGVLTGIGNVANQKSLYDAAVAAAAELGSYHPQATSLPLQNISIRRIGADRAEYAAEYGHTGGSFTDNSRVRIESWFDGKAYESIPWGSEVASGRRWTPNEQPPFYRIVPVVSFKVTRVVTTNSLTAVNAAIAGTGLIGKINDGNVTIGGVTYPTQSLRFDGITVDYSPSNILGGVDIVYEYSMRRFVDADGGARGWVNGGYQRISTRPYWQPVWVPMSQPVSFNTIT